MASDVTDKESPIPMAISVPIRLRMSAVSYLKRTPLWIVIFLIGFVTFFTYQIRISEDMQWYCKTALNVYQGEGFVDTNGSPVLVRPVFPYMIALAYWLLGPSHWSAFWVVRLFCILNPIMIYFLGKALFGKWVGFSAALFVLSSWALDAWSYRHLDAIWPFWILTSIYLMVKRPTGKSRVFYLIAGICMGIGFLIKEVAMLFLFFPVLLFAGDRRYRTKKHIGNLAVFYASFVLLISPWVGYQLSNGGIGTVAFTAPTVASAIVNPEESGFLKEWGATTFENNTSKLKKLFHKAKASGKILFGFFILTVLGGVFSRKIMSHRKLRMTAIGFVIFMLIFSLYLLGFQNIFIGFSNFYSGQRNSLAANFSLAPLMIISWVVMFYLAVKRDQSALIIICAALCYLPIIYFMGLSGFRLGQGLIFYQLSYLAIAAAAMTVSQKISVITSRSEGYKVSGQSFCFILFSAGIIVAQTFLTTGNDIGYWGFLKKRSYAYLKVSGYVVREYVNHKLFGFNAKHLHGWLKKNVPENSIVMISERDYIMNKYHYFGQSHRLIGMRIIESRRAEVLEDYQDHGPLVLISAIVRKEKEKSDLLTIREPDLLKTIRKNGVHYVIVTKRRNYLSRYFDRHDGFIKIKEFGRGALKIYTVKDPHPSQNIIPLISTRLVRYLRWLADSRPDMIGDYVQDIFKPLLGWDLSIVKSFYSSPEKELLRGNFQGHLVVKNGVVY